MWVFRDPVVATIRRQAMPLQRIEDLDPLVDRIGSARFVLLGESSHGTSDFHRWRAELTKRLLTERGFSFVAVAGDWPDCHRLHRCLAGDPTVPGNPQDVLERFHRWPHWMWANDEVLEFATWLRRLNAARFADAPVGFHGLDVYSLWDSLDEVVRYLRVHEPEYLSTGLAALRCFESYGEPLRDYAGADAEQPVDPDVPGPVVPDGCAQDVARLLTRVRRETMGEFSPGIDEQFVAWQNAEVVSGAEQYYREMLRGGARAWNVRDRHMAHTLVRLGQTYGTEAKAVVWAHNAHVGDARATDMAEAGMLNLGQLVREHGRADEVATVGFGTHHGTVIAADSQGGQPRNVRVPQARRESLEDVLHQAVPDRDSLFVLRPGTHGWSEQVWDHRAIGSVYRPQHDRNGNYMPTVPAHRYDAFVHCDSSTSLTPLHIR